MIITLKGQIRGGKNNIKITRTGRRYPDPLFVAWSADALRQIIIQIGPAHCRKPIDNFNYEWFFTYTPEDNRRRDLPAILDAIFHVLENAGVVSDDRYIMNTHTKLCPVDKNYPAMIIEWKLST